MSDWLVHEHGPLTAVVPGLWQVTGTLPKAPPRNMVVARLPDGRLWVHSAICLDPDGMAALAALGDVGVVVVPNRMHRYDAPRWRARFPDATFVCPATARAAVETVVLVDDTCESALPALGVTVRALDGWKPGELAYEVPVDRGVALVFCDCVFNLDHQPGFIGWTIKMAGSTGFFGTTGIGRWFFMADRARWKAWLARESARSDVRAICMGHGTAITEDCAAALAGAAARL